MALSGGRPGDGLLLQGLDDHNIQGCRLASLPVRKIDVSGMAVGSGDE